VSTVSDRKHSVSAIITRSQKWAAEETVSKEVHGTPVTRSKFAEIFGIRKLESPGYHVVFIVWSYAELF